MAFGPSRHHAWVVSRRALGGSFGVRGRPLGGFLGAIWRHIGCRFGSSVGPLGTLLGPRWGPLGASWGLVGASRVSLGVFGRHLEAEGSGVRFVFPLLGPPRGSFGLSRSRLGRRLGRPGVLLGRRGALSGASWAVSWRSWGPFGPSWSVGSSKLREPTQTLTNLSQIHDLCLSGPSWEGSWGSPWGVSKASWAVFGPFWASWTDPSAIRGPLGLSWGPLGGLLARLGALLGRLSFPGTHATHPDTP